MPIKLVTAEQMHHIDHAATERGITILDLMESAGQAVADDIMENYKPNCVGIVAGKGNNAGDGFVTARLLAEQNVSVKLIHLTLVDDMSDAGAGNFRKLPESVQIFDRLSVPEMPEIFSECEIVVDAILGTGISGPAKGTAGEAIAMVNSLDIPVVAVDIPSGLNADTGIAEGACVFADRTITMGLPKIGMIINDGLDFCGDIIIADIGFPDDLINSPDLNIHLLEHEDAVNAFPPRPRSGHKGTFGSVLVIAGSLGFSGAAYLTTNSALRSGCGMVYTAFPEGVTNLLESQLIEAIKIQVSGEKNFLSHNAWEDLEPHIQKASAIALGPGLGTDQETARLVDEIVCQSSPMVIDADALNCLAEKIQYLIERNAPTILTPHPGEMSRLLGISIQEVQNDRIESARRLARESSAIVILKGAQSIVATPEGQVFINPTGNSGMAKGGSGDVLTGLLAGFLAQGCSALDAACAGVYLHGLAGDLAREALGERAMIARDILDYLPSALISCE